MSNEEVQELFGEARADLDSFSSLNDVDFKERVVEHIGLVYKIMSLLWNMIIESRKADDTIVKGFRDGLHQRDELLEMAVQRIENLEEFLVSFISLKEKLDYKKMGDLASMLNLNLKWNEEQHKAILSGMAC